MYQIDFNQPMHIHFIGIGGISMSGLAEILIKEGFQISGSDAKDSSIIASLRQLGATIYIGQAASNITADLDLIVYTAAIHSDNQEFQAAVASHKPMLTRAQLLGQIMANYHKSIAVSGTHGKTTTTSMLSHILLSAQRDPTISIGGILDAINGNIRVGNSEYFLTEACEYTNSYHSLNPLVSIILNVDADHLDFFSGIEEIIQSFRTFAMRLSNEGTLIINGDMDCLHTIISGLDCKIITFGKTDKCTYWAKDISYNPLGCATFTAMEQDKALGRITLSVTGEHNVLNSLSAIAAARIFQIDFAHIQEGLQSCGGAKRRFEYKGILDGVTIIDDYAHHPTEIAATLTAAQKTQHQDIWCIFQPHTFSRTKALLPEFAQALSHADHVILAKIYPAREVDTGEISSADLAKLINEQYGTDVIYLDTFDQIEAYVKKNCKKNDMLITMGAGDVVNIGNSLLNL